MQFCIYIHILVFQHVIPIRDVTSCTAISEGMEEAMEFESCYICSRVLGTFTQGDVRYDKVSLCLLCHLMERERKQIKGKGTVERILQQCGRCHGDSAVAADCTPTWFCYDCCQYLCTQCEQDVHSERKNHVRC